MGVPDPLDHIIFTLILFLAVYVPTKFIHTLLNTCYGESPSSVEKISSADNTLQIS